MSELSDALDRVKELEIVINKMLKKVTNAETVLSKYVGLYWTPRTEFLWDSIHKGLGYSTGAILESIPDHVYAEANSIGSIKCTYDENFKWWCCISVNIPFEERTSKYVTCETYSNESACNSPEEATKAAIIVAKNNIKKETE